MKVGDLMTHDVVTVAPEQPLKEVARLLTAHRISGLPVCDADGRVLGVVSEADILRKEEGFAPEPGGLLGWLFEKADAEVAALVARTAGEAMTSPAVTVTPTASVAEAARLMTEKAINRLPVVEQGRLSGIVSRADLVRAFQRSDEEIERELADDVLLHTLWIAPADVRITVDAGVVNLAGSLDSRSEAELVAAYARRVPGVVDVDSELTWRFDDLSRRVSRQRLPARL